MPTKKSSLGTPFMGTITDNGPTNIKYLDPHTAANPNTIVLLFIPITALEENEFTPGQEYANFKKVKQALMAHKYYLAVEPDDDEIYCAGVVFGATFIIGKVTSKQLLTYAKSAIKKAQLHLTY